MLSVVAIPSLMKMLAGSIVEIDALPLLLSTSQVVMLPLCGGFLLKSVAPGLVRRVSSILPLSSVIGVTLICGSIVARTSFSSFGPMLVLGIALLHALGGLIGFIAAKACKLPTKACRTVSIEVMMQNSSLAVALALAHFASPLVAVPGAISATMVRGQPLEGVICKIALGVLTRYTTAAPLLILTRPSFYSFLLLLGLAQHSVMGSALAGGWRYLDSHKTKRAKAE